MIRDAMSNRLSTQGTELYSQSKLDLAHEWCLVILSKGRKEDYFSKNPFAVTKMK
jgi:hypothetical protein